MIYLGEENVSDAPEIRAEVGRGVWVNTNLVRPGLTPVRPLKVSARPRPRRGRADYILNSSARIISIT